MPASELPPPPKSATRVPAKPSRVVTYVAGALLLVVVAATWFIVDQMQSIEENVNELGAQVAEAEARAAQATARADASDANVAIANERATAAESEASQANERADTADARADDEAAARAQADELRRAAETEADFAAQEANRAADAARAARAETDEIKAQREREISRLAGALGAIADTQRTALGLVMNLGEDAVNFDFDKADLKPEDRELLSRIVGVLLTWNGYRIQVFGHTDDVGDADYNQALSVRRANAVANYLVSHGIDASIVITQGFGKSKPLIESTSEAARARNRRVELGVIDTVVEYGAEATVSGERQ